MGHKISSMGIQVDQVKVEVIFKLPLPIAIKGVRNFLGYVGFFWRFIKNFSKIAHPLCKLLEKDIVFIVDDACIKDFECLIEKHTLAPL